MNPATRIPLVLAVLAAALVPLSHGVSLFLALPAIGMALAHPDGSDVADTLLTGDVARVLGVSAETVRFWERTGILPARKTERGVRLFDRRDVERLAREREAGRSASEEGAVTTQAAAADESGP